MPDSSSKEPDLLRRGITATGLFVAGFTASPALPLAAAGAATAALLNSGCESRSGMKKPSLKEALKIIAEKGAITVDGEAVNAEELLERLKGKYVTLSFGFSRCEGANGAKSLCTNLASARGCMRKVSEKIGADITDIIVNVDPDIDAQSEFLRDVYHTATRNNGGSDDSETLFANTHKGAVEIQRALGLTVQDDYRNHSPDLFLFDPNGEMITRRPATTKEATDPEWWIREINNHKTPTKPASRAR